MHKKPRRWAVRTVKNGRVLIFGYWYRPSNTHLKYDGRFENWRLIFGLYARYDEDGWCGYEPFVYLWGTEHRFRERNPHAVDTTAVNGTLPWSFWRRDDN